MKMLVGVTSIIAIASVGVIYLLNSPRISVAGVDPKSAEFAALCNVALTIYYVKGGTGPEFVEKSRRARHWSKIYHERFKRSGDPSDRNRLETWTSIQRVLEDANRDKDIDGKNRSMKQIMDMCAPHER